MKKSAVVSVFLVLTGCTEIENYDDVVKTPAPAGLEGYWQSEDPQHSLMGPEAVASLVITREGDTLSCHQWRWVVALSGELTMLPGDPTSVTVKRELYEIERENNTLEYDGVTLQRMDRPAQECTDVLKKTPLTTPLP